MYTSETNFTNVIKSSQPPIIEPPSGDRRSNLSRSPIRRTNDTSTQSFDHGQRSNMLLVQSPTVQTRDVIVSRARRTLTDDGSADVVHHIGIVAPPASYSIVERPLPQIRTAITTSTTDQYQLPQVTTIDPPDFVDRSQIPIRKHRIPSNIAQPSSDDLIDGALSTSQQILIKDDDYDSRLRRPVQIITSTETEIITSRRPPAKIYTPVPQTEAVQICQADRVESDSGNYDLSMVNVRSTITLNQAEVNELNLLAQQAQRLQISPRDYDHAMIILSPEHTQYQHNIDHRPLLLAAANIDRLQEQTHEHVTRHMDQPVQRQHTQLITPIPEHMARVEQDISVFENISSAIISQPSRSRLNEVPHDSGIVSLNTSQASEQPVVLNASRVQRLESSDEQRLDNLHEDDYYRKRIRALDLLRHVDTDPYSNLPPVHTHPFQVFENTTAITSPILPTAQTRLLDNERLDHMQTLEHTDEPVIYESIDQHLIYGIPQQEHLSSSDIDQDDHITQRAEENQLVWRQRPRPPPPPVPVQQHQISEVPYEQIQALIPDSPDRREHLRSTEEITDRLETPKHPNKSIIYNYGKSFTSFFLLQIPNQRIETQTVDIRITLSPSFLRELLCLARQLF